MRRYESFLYLRQFCMKPTDFRIVGSRPPLAECRLRIHLSAPKRYDDVTAAGASGHRFHAPHAAFISSRLAIDRTDRLLGLGVANDEHDGRIRRFVMYRCRSL
jgi:hypothetical protein